MSTCLSVCQSVCLPACLSVILNVDLSDNQYVCLSVCLPASQSVQNVTTDLLYHARCFCIPRSGYLQMRYSLIFGIIKSCQLLSHSLPDPLQPPLPSVPPPTSLPLLSLLFTSSPLHTSSPLTSLNLLHPSDPHAKKQAESARVIGLQTLRRNLAGKYSQQTLLTLENIDVSVVNKVRLMA